MRAERDSSRCTDEPYGPVVVCVLIFAAVLTNFILRVKHRFVLFLSQISSLSGKTKMVFLVDREELRDTPSPKNPWITTATLVKSVFVDQAASLF